jgi:hypothetical protein
VASIVVILFISVSCSIFNFWGFINKGKRCISKKLIYSDIMRRYYDVYVLWMQCGQS